MTDENKLAQALSRAARADMLMRDELLTEAFAAFEHGCIETWATTTARDTDARERLWQAVQVCRKVKDHLGRVIADGKMAQREIDLIAERRKRFRVI